jgi:hypothetical protein
MGMMPEFYILNYQWHGTSMATEYQVKMCVTLEPVGNPWAIIDVNGQGQLQQLITKTDFSFNFNTTDSGYLTIEHFKKQDNDPVTAVIVKEISFFGISDPKFIWAGVYHPDYPAHYPNKISSLPGQGYLGWNGVYRLDFSVPVFTWIHKIKNFGWIYG